MDTATLTAAVGAVLTASGLRETPCRPVGDGYLVEPMTQCGPERVAVRCPALDRCRAALTTAGYRVETVHAPVTYIAVLPPPGS
jgi:hypothetical protein